MTASAVFWPMKTLTFETSDFYKEKPLFFFLEVVRLIWKFVLPVQPTMLYVCSEEC